MAANMQAKQELTPVEYMDAALVFLRKAKDALSNAPKREKDYMAYLTDEVDGFKESLPDDLYESIWDAGEECQDCHLCQRDPGGPWDEATRECNAAEPMACPAVREVLE